MTHAFVRHSVASTCRHGNLRKKNIGKSYEAQWSKWIVRLMSYVFAWFLANTFCHYAIIHACAIIGTVDRLASITKTLIGYFDQLLLFARLVSQFANVAIIYAMRISQSLKCKMSWFVKSSVTCKLCRLCRKPDWSSPSTPCTCTRVDCVQWNTCRRNCSDNQRTGSKCLLNQTEMPIVL